MTPVTEPAELVPVNSAELDRYLKSELGAHLLRPDKWTWTVHCAVAIALFLSAPSSAPAWTFGAAAALICVTSLIRSAVTCYSGALQDRQPLGLNAKGWYVASVFFLSTAYASISVPAILFGDNTKIFAATTVIFATAIVTAMNLSASIKLAVASASIMLTVLGIMLVFFTQGSFVILGLGTLVGIFGIYINSAKTRAALVERVTLQYRHLVLIEQLEEQKGALQFARDAADQANAAKSSFLAHASHDLRQPLHAIGLFLESLPEEYDDDRTGHAMSRVRESHRQLSDLFDTLLDVSVIDVGEVEVKLFDFALGKLLNQIVAEFQPLAAQNGPRIRHVRTEAWVQADPQLLGRMIRNLLSNALRYGGGQDILIGCRRRDGQLAVEVVDRGHGLSEDEVSRAFSEFTRLRRKEDGQSVPGFGLGLTIVARLAELQDLSVSVRSIPGRGSWFQINGLALTRQAQSIAQADAEQSPDVAHTRVLVIDDDPKVLDATRALLEKWNFAVEVDEKFDPKKHRRPDILVCDYELSDRLDGFSVIQAARAAFGADLPAIMISGTTDESLAKRADQLGLPLLHKPVRPAQLRSALLHAGQGKH